MVVGLGTGSTASHAIKYLAEKIKSGKIAGIKGVATSDTTHELVNQTEHRPQALELL